ncbi:MAG: RDD family protein [Deltaproteobacteria bacterium]|jgi:uncharacterized RDD family membrane protein YckC|nr:RDD family protein [Deltaproteobacteria bacterium]
MAIKIDRVGEFLEGVKHKRRVLITPEGIPLDVRIAGHGERLGAFAVDIVFMGLAVLALYLLLWLLFFSGSNLSVGMTIILFAAFVVRNLYFVHFELAWQGRTPGKRLCKLRVINRKGGELAPSAVIARNLTREVEFFLPLSLLFSLPSGWQEWCMLGWTLCLTSLPFVNRYHLRIGDLIGGTQVIAMPRRVLLADLSLEAASARAAALLRAPAAPEPGPVTPVKVEDLRPAVHTLQAPVLEAEPVFVFSHEQLSRYGAFELQVLEEFLRRQPSNNTQRLLEEVCRKICNKIGWEGGEIPPGRVRRFLTDFYTAERADLERGQLFGRLRADKNAAAENRKPDKPY